MHLRADVRDFFKGQQFRSGDLIDSTNMLRGLKQDRGSAAGDVGFSRRRQAPLAVACEITPLAMAGATRMLLMISE